MPAKPPVGRRFTKGRSGNPEGGRAHNPALRALKKLTIETYREAIEQVMTGNLAQLQDTIKNPESTALQVGIATAFLKAIKNGDYAVVERIAERIVGKIPDELNVKNTTAMTVKTIDQAKVAEAYKLLEKDV